MGLFSSAAYTSALAFYDEVAAAWELEAIEYTVHVGSSSRDLPLSAAFEVR